MNFKSTIIIVLLAIAPTTAVAWFHNRLVKSVPGAEEVVSGPPKEIRLWFTEKVEPKFSSVSLLKPDSTKVEAGKAHATDDPKSIAVEVTAPLAAGSYTVVWRTAGDDGHAVRGRYGFSVK